MMTEEIWKPIPGFEGLYEVSNLGQVKSLPKDLSCGRGNGMRKTPSRIIKPYKDKSGDLKIQLFIKTKRYSLSLKKLLNLVYALC